MAQGIAYGAGNIPDGHGRANRALGVAFWLDVGAVLGQCVHSAFVHAWGRHHLYMGYVSAGVVECSTDKQSLGTITSYIPINRCSAAPSPRKSCHPPKGLPRKVATTLVPWTSLRCCKKPVRSLRCLCVSGGWLDSTQHRM